MDESKKRQYLVAVTVDGETLVVSATPEDIAQFYAADDSGQAPFDCLWIWALDADPDDPSQIPDAATRPALVPLTVELFTLPPDEGGGIGVVIARRPNGDVEFAVMYIGEPGARKYVGLLL